MISAQQIRELRERTGAGVADIKLALEESGGDMEVARAAIERRLGTAAGKRAGRETRAGVVDAYIHANGRVGAMAHISCETDFVARNPDFQRLAHDITMQIAAMEPADVSALQEQPFIKGPNKKISAIINEAIGRFGENIKIEKFERFEL